MSPTASKNITLFIFSWSVSSRGSGLYQDLLKLTVIQFQQINQLLCLQLETPMSR